jgi:hypothetical protein
MNFAGKIWSAPFVVAALFVFPLLAARSEQGLVRKDHAFTEFFRRTSGWTAGDGALSVPLSDGRVLWLFGDSHLDDFDTATGTMPCLFQMRNAALLHRKQDLQNIQTLAGRGPGFKSWFKHSTNEDLWFWPVTGFQNGNTVYVYLASLRKTTAGGQWGFESTGHDSWGNVKFPEMKEITYAPLPPFHGITFGQGFVKEGEYIYAFGGKGSGLASDIFVARFKSENPENQWAFWDGRSWDGNVTNAAPIARGASTSIHVCKVRDKFVLTTSAFSIACDQGKEILMATSTSPTGPFSPLKKIFTIGDVFEGHYPFFYFPVAHPEFINEHEELLVTYSINGYEPCVPACGKGRAIPDHYRPKAIRVPLAMIGVK